MIRQCAPVVVAAAIVALAAFGGRESAPAPFPVPDDQDERVGRGAYCLPGPCQSLGNVSGWSRVPAFGGGSWVAVEWTELDGTGGWTMHQDRVCVEGGIYRVNVTVYATVELGATWIMTDDGRGPPSSLVHGQWGSYPDRDVARATTEGVEAGHPPRVPLAGGRSIAATLQDLIDHLDRLEHGQGNIKQGLGAIDQRLVRVESDVGTLNSRVPESDNSVVAWPDALREELPQVAAA